MKRSEMIRIMANELQDCISSGGMGYLTIADTLLSLQEEAGMSPPRYYRTLTEDDEINYDHDDSSDPSGYRRLVWTWEPE